MEPVPEAGILLAPYRVLDLTEAEGHLCGRLLADLGADVLKIEPPEGDSARRRGPFYQDIPDPEGSMSWWFFNLNKRGITLNLTSAQGRELLIRLVQKADVLIESFTPGLLTSLGLGHHELSQVNPRLVYTSITPFGQTGPYAHYQGPDIVGQAMGGLMYVTGDPDRPPLRVSFPQTYLTAAAQGAVGTLLALQGRASTGLGQHVDVSAQQSVIWTLMNVTITWDLNRRIIGRAGPFRAGNPNLRIRLNWRCKDGYVCFSFSLAGNYGRSTQALMAWMEEEGMAPDYLKFYDVGNVDLRTLPQEEVDLLCEPIADFFLAHTKEELFQGALKRRIILYPVSTMKDLAANQQLLERGLFQRARHPGLGREVSYPGPAPLFNGVRPPLRRWAPLLGEHNVEVYCGELGLKVRQLKKLASLGVV